jgi:glycosyltransferase involved in cell wall biosynthesis
MKQRPHLSVVIPVYNEQESVGLLCEKVRAACDPLGVPYELILVDDGSKDGTFEKLAVFGTVRQLFGSQQFGQPANLDGCASDRHADRIPSQRVERIS